MAREKCFLKSKQIETSRMRYLRQSYAPALNISSEFESFRSLFLFIAINLTSKYLFEFSIWRSSRSRSKEFRLAFICRP